MVPCWGSLGRDVPPETQFLLLELADGGPYAILLPLIDHGAFRATLRPSGSGTESCVGCVIMSSFNIIQRPSCPQCAACSDKHGISLRIESNSADVQAAHWSGTDVVPLYLCICLWQLST